MLDISQIREQFPILDEKVYGKPLIYFDNGATTPPFKCVNKEIMKHMQMYGSIGRGKGPKSEYSTRVYEKCREYIKQYFNIAGDNKYTVIFEVVEVMFDYEYEIKRIK